MTEVVPFGHTWLDKFTRNSKACSKVKATNEGKTLTQGGELRYLSNYQLIFSIGFLVLFLQLLIRIRDLWPDLQV